MISASFFTLVYWFAFGALAVYVMVAAEKERQRRTRIRQLRERRQRLDARTPQRWVQP